MASVIQKIEALYQRLERARAIVAEGRIHPVLGKPDHYVVQSTKGDGFYLVNGTCICPDATERAELTKGLCKHKLAAVLFSESQTDAKPSQVDVSDLYPQS